MLPKDRLLVVAGALNGEKVPQLWRMNPDGSARLRLTHERLPCRQPHWSPTGSTILYALATGDDPSTDEEKLEWWRCAPDGTQRTKAQPPTTSVPLARLEIIESGGTVSGFRVPGSPLRKLTLSPAAEKFWDETGISGGPLRLVALPHTEAFVLAVQLAGGNREGKWHTAVKVELATGKAEPWGEYGWSGFCVSPDNRQFVTCFNRMVNRKEEHALYVGSMSAPRQLKRLLTSPEMVFADWCGGKRVL